MSLALGLGVFVRRSRVGELCLEGPAPHWVKSRLLLFGSMDVTALSGPSCGKDLLPAFTDRRQRTQDKGQEND